MLKKIIDRYLIDHFEGYRSYREHALPHYGSFKGPRPHRIIIHFHESGVDIVNPNIVGRSTIRIEYANPNSSTNYTVRSTN